MLSIPQLCTQLVTGRLALGPRCAVHCLSITSFLPPLLYSLVCSILAESWREEADIGRVLWALQQLFHEALMARMPLAHPPAFML